jgi:hypothetical protein
MRSCLFLSQVRPRLLGLRLGLDPNATLFNELPLILRARHIDPDDAVHKAGIVIVRVLAAAGDGEAPGGDPIIPTPALWHVVCPTDVGFTLFTPIR